MARSQPRPEAVLLAVNLVWGSTFIVSRQVVRHSAPLPYAALRFMLAAVIMLALHGDVLKGRRRLWHDGIILGIGQGLGLLLQLFGQVYTTASKSAFITSLATVLTPVWALACYGRRPTLKEAAALLLAGGGVVLLTYPSEQMSWNRGDLYTLASALIYAGVIVETARRARHHSAGELTAVQIATAAALFVLLLVLVRTLLVVLPPAWVPAVFEPERRGIDATPWFALQLVYMAVVCTVAALAAQTWAMGRMNATRAAVLLSLEPVFATLFAVLVDGGDEWPGLRGAGGALLVLVGVAVAELRWRRPWGRRMNRMQANV